MQIVVLGMHRSGTSVVTGMLSLMGAYLGPEEAHLDATRDNPRGYGERRDVVELDKALLGAAGANWYRVHGFTPENVPEAARERFDEAARQVVLELDAHRPWVVKEPRLCLLFPFWRRHLEVPVCVLVHRCPLQVAHSLKTRDGFPLIFGLALWERYVRTALEASAGIPRCVVAYEELMADPVAAVGRLHARLTELGVRDLRSPDRDEILSRADPALHHHRQSVGQRDEYLVPSQAALVRALERGTEPELDEAVLSPAADDVLAMADEAYVKKRSLEALRDEHALQSARLATLEEAWRDQAGALAALEEQTSSQAVELAALRRKPRAAKRATAPATSGPNGAGEASAIDAEAWRRIAAAQSVELERFQDENCSHRAELEVLRRELHRRRSRDHDLRTEIWRLRAESRYRQEVLDQTRAADQKRGAELRKVRWEKSRLDDAYRRRTAKYRDLEDAYQRRTAKCRDLESTMARRGKEFREQQAAAKRRIQAAEAIESSNTWKLARFLASLYRALTLRWLRSG